MPTSWDPPRWEPPSGMPVLGSHPDPTIKRRPAPQWPVAIVVVLLTAAAYLATVGWDQDVVADPNEGLRFPTVDLYEVWQVYLLFSLLTAVQAGGTWLVRGGTTLAALCTTLTVCWSVDAATDPGASTWPIGTVMLLGVSAIFFGIVWGLVSLVRPDELVRDVPAG